MQIVHLSRFRNAFITWAIVSLGVLFVFNTTAPDRLGPQGITIFFGVLYLFFSLSIQLLVLMVIRFSKRHHWYSVWRPSFSFVYGFIPVSALALQSLDQLVLRDILIFTGLALIIAFYINKR